MPLPAALAAAMLAWRGELWGAGIPLFGNLIFLFHPLIRQVDDQLAAGRVPLWNPYAFCGAPLLADPQAGVLSATQLAHRFFAFPTAFRIKLAADILIIGFFGYCLGRRLGLRRSCAALAAFLACCNGFVYYHAGLISHMDSLAWMPAVLLFWSAGWSLLMGIALALQYFGGHPFFVYITLLACLFLRPRRPFATLAIAAGAALSFAAVQLLPALELFSLSGRQGALSPGSVFTYSLAPDELWRMLTIPWWNREAGHFSGDPTITSFYVGLPALAAALWGAWSLRRARGPAALALCSLWLMMGNHTPFYPLLLKALPGLDHFRYPAQWGWPASLGLALAAGYGLQSLRPAHRAALALLILADLAAFMAVPPTARVKPEFYALRPATLSEPAVASGPRIAHTRRFLEAQSRDPARQDESDAYWLSLKSALVPSHASVFGLREAASYNITAPSRLESLLRRALVAGTTARPFLSFLGVSALIDGDETGRHRVEGLAAARQRLTWVGRAETMPYPRALEHLTGKGFAPEREVLLEKEAPPAPEGPRPGGVILRALDESPNRLRAAIEAGGDGFVVLADSFAPGWRAYVDGARVPVLRANGAFRAAAVPGGASEIVFLYRPMAFAAGVALTLISFGVIAAIVLRRALCYPNP